MSIEINNESGDGRRRGRSPAARTFALDTLHVHPDADLAIVFVDEAAMEQLHVQWMDEPGPTDVLSFPMDELRPGTEDEPDARRAARRHRRVPAGRGGPGETAGHSTAGGDHAAHAHGILHLLGFDHAEPDEEREMFGLQRDILVGFADAASAGGDGGCVALFLTVAFVLVVFGGLLAAGDAAHRRRCRRADIAGARRLGLARRRSLLAIAADTGAHINAVNFVRIIAETSAAVLVTLAFACTSSTNWWLALLVSAAIMTAVSFVLVGASPRSVGRAHARPLARRRGAVVRGVRVVLGPLADALVALGNRVTPGRPRSRPRSPPRSSCSAWSTRPPSSTCSRRTTASSSTRSSSSATPSSAR